MTLLETTLDFMKDPDNSWILYSISLFLIADAVLGRFISQYAMIFKGNNSGIATNNNVEANIAQTQADTPNKETMKTASKVIGMIANICAILGLLLAATTFYLTM